MKKLIILSLFLSLTNLFATDEKTISMLHSEDINLAQNARMIIEKSENAQEILLNALKSEERQLLKDGIIYSLASINSEDAFPLILELAQSGDKVAIVALSKYGEKAKDFLNNLAKTNDNAKIASDLASKKFPIEKIPNPYIFYELSKMEQRKILMNIKKLRGCMRFLENIKFDEPFTLMATYSRLGGNLAAERILKIQEENNLDISPNSPALNMLSACDDCELALTTAALQGNIYAIRALKYKGIAYAEPILTALINDSNAIIRKEALESLATCGSAKALKSLAHLIPNVKEEDLSLYVKTATAIYNSLNDTNKNELKVLLTKKLSSVSDKNKSAIERIIAEN